MVEASRAASVSSPGTSAARSPTRITAPGSRMRVGRGPGHVGRDRPGHAGGHRAGHGLRGASAGSTVTGASAARSGVPSAASTRGSSPGTVASRVPNAFRTPLVSHGATANSLCPRLRAALRSRRKTIGDSSSGSKPTSSTAGAASSSPYVTAPVSGPSPATREARKSSSSAECARARASTSLVPSATRANFAYA